jgi:hypothetical protein
LRVRISDTKADSLLVTARRDPRNLALLDVEIWLGEHRPAPDWAVWLADVQRVARGESQLGFWVGAAAAPGSYIVDFDVRGDPPGYRGIWRVLSHEPVVTSPQGSILLARRALHIDGRRLGSNQTWRRALGAARLAAGGGGRWKLQAFAEAFLRRRG